MQYQFRGWDEAWGWRAEETEERGGGGPLNQGQRLSYVIILAATSSKVNLHLLQRHPLPPPTPPPTPRASSKLCVHTVNAEARVLPRARPGCIAIKFVYNHVFHQTIRLRKAVDSPDKEVDLVGQSECLLGGQGKCWRGAYTILVATTCRCFLLLLLLFLFCCCCYCFFVFVFFTRVQELCESRGGRPGLSVLTSLTVSVDVKQH